MKLIINEDRTTISIGTWGTKNENNYEILNLEIPSKFENFNKRIVYYLGEEIKWDLILNNEVLISNAITTFKKVKAYIWLTKGEEITLKYTCTGQETGSYYFTYNNETYYFIMPQVQANDELIFDVATEKLKLNNTEIQTSSIGLGTELEFTTLINASEDFRTKLFEMNFYENDNADGIIPTEQEVDGFNTMISTMNDKIEEMDEKIEQVDDEIQEVEEAITGVENLDIDVSDKVNGDVSITLTRKNGTQKTVILSDGTSLMFDWNGTSLGIKTEDDEEYTYVDLQGVQGPVGPQGEAFRIKKTYSSIEAMNADFANMQVGDYVMIASTVEIEDNAKLYTRGEQAWIFISDFSGAQGIKGETGSTPNIQIGTVTSGNVPSVTRSGTDENPVLNFTLVPGQKGDKGDTGATGATGNGIASITKTGTNGLIDIYTITYTNGNTTTFTVTNGRGIVSISKTSTEGLIDTYTITYNDGTTSTFTVTNGEDGEVTQEELEEVQEQVTYIQEFIDSETEVATTEKSTTVDTTDSAKWYGKLEVEGRTTQEEYSGKNKFDINNLDIRNGGVQKTIDGDTVELEAITTTGTQFVGEIIEGLDANETYTFSCKAKKIVCESTGDPRLRVYLAGSNDGETYTVISRDDILSPVVNTEYSFVRSFTGYTYLRIYLYNRAESTVVIGEKTQYYDIQLEKGDTATDYEPYCGGQASPSPEFPQPIENVEGRSCRNLIDYTTVQSTSKTSVELIENGFKVLGKWAGQIVINDLKTNTDYYLQYIRENIVGTSKRVGIFAGTTQSSIIKNLYSSGTFNTGENTTINIWFYVSTDGEANFTNIQLNEGSTALPYEPYFEGEGFEFMVCNKNLLNPTEFASKVVNSPYNSSNISVYDFETGELNTMMGNNSVVYDNFKEDTRYTIILATSDDTSGLLNLRINYTDGTFTNLSKTNAGLFVTAANKSVMNIIHTAGNSSDVRVIKLFESGIFEGALTASDFIQHKQQMIPFPMQDGQKLMEGDYLADDGVHHMRGQVVLDGTENWHIYNISPEKIQHYFNISNVKHNASNIVAMSNYFVGIKLNDRALYNNSVYSVTVGLGIRCDDYTTIEDWKNWLAEQYANGTPVIIEYELAQETIDPYTPEQAEAYNKLKKIMLNQGVNHIWTNTDGLEPNLQLTYYKSNKERLNNIEARLELLEN